MALATKAQTPKALKICPVTLAASCFSWTRAARGLLMPPIPQRCERKILNPGQSSALKHSLLPGWFASPRNGKTRHSGFARPLQPRAFEVVLHTGPRGLFTNCRGRTTVPVLTALADRTFTEVWFVGTDYSGILSGKAVSYAAPRSLFLLRLHTGPPQVPQMRLHNGARNSQAIK